VESVPEAPSLRGRLVALEPLDLTDADALYPSASDPEVWRWKLVERPQTVDDMRTLISETMLGPERQAYVIRLLDSGRAIGSTTLARFDVTHGRVELGFTWLERACWGQGFNEDSKQLLLDYVFRVLEFDRLELQVDAENGRSQRALERMGCVREGSLRSRHRRPDGSRRDSLMYSVLRNEWPDVEQRLRRLVLERSLPGLARDQNNAASTPAADQVNQPVAQR
jgi:RimJ/RimL family protein N-acetyltransferase